jgi:hypothetical protein
MNQRALLLTYSIFSSALTCVAQFTHGTAVIAISTGSFGVVAADSFSIDEKNISKEDACKIALAGHIGVVSIGGMGTVGSTNLAAEGASILATAKVKSEDDLLRATETWKVKMIGIFSSYIRSNNPSVRWAAEQHQGATAIFMTLDPSDRVLLTTSSFFLGVMPSNEVQIMPGTTVVRKVDNGVNGMAIMGHFGAETWREIVAGHTSRSKPLNALANTILYSKSPSSLKSAAKQFISTAESWYPTEVNGPIDEVTLDKTGRRWKHVKPNCTSETQAR